MRRLFTLVVDRPFEVALAWALVAALGGYAAARMSVDLFPSLDVPVVNVVSHEPGVSATDLELRVTRPIEEALRGAPGIRRVASTTTQGVSAVTAEFTWGTAVATAQQTVAGRIAQVQPRLPAGVNPVLEQIGTTLDQVGGWALYGAGDPADLAVAVRGEIAARLMAVEGVSRVDVAGGERRAFVVEARPERLAAAGVTVSGLVAAIRRAGGAEAAGMIERSGEGVVVRADSRILGLDDLASVPVEISGGGSVRLDALAAVGAGRVPRSGAVRAEGVPAVALFVRKQPAASSIAVVAGVERALAALGPLLPPGARAVRFYDQSEVLVAARRTILFTLAAGALLAVLVLGALLGALRPTLAVAVTIPLALLAALVVLRLSGQGLNVITLAALTLAVGMVVDDAIVVAESIFRAGERGLPAAPAAVTGAVDIAAADASGTFTTVAAFLPLLLIGGLSAVFLRPFGLAVSAALLASLVLSLTLVPAVLGGARGEGEAAPGAPRPGIGTRAVAALGEQLDRALSWTLGRRRATLAGALAVAVLALGTVAVVHGPIALLPPVDEGALLVEYVLPPGVSLAESERVGGEIAAVARAQPGVVAVVLQVGSPAEGSQTEGVDRGELFVKLAPVASGRASAEAISARLRRATAGVEGAVLLFHQPTQERIDESFSGLPALFGVTVYGADLDAIEAAAGQVAELLRADPAVGAVVDNSRFRRRELVARIDNDRCAALGVDPAAARTAVAAAVWGVEAGRVIRPSEEIPILVRLAGFGGVGGGGVAGGGLDGGLDALPVAAGDGGLVPLGRVADLVVSRVPARIDRLNGQRELTLTAEVEGDLLAVAGRIGRRLAALDLPAGTSAAVSGEYPALLATAGDLLVAFAVAALLILLIMTAQFRSARQALWILAVVPVSLAGAAAGLAITGAPLDVSVAAAALTLLGIGVNNGIVLIDFTNRRVAAGDAPAEALRTAARTRLRPILATSLTTIAGLVPTALTLGSGANLFASFAVAVIFGLAAGTAATLLVLPVAALPAVIARLRPRRPFSLRPGSGLE